MAIEFPCEQCGAMLRVGDELAGRAAQCPQCRAIETVPDSRPVNPLTENGSNFVAATTSRQPDTNPYAVPTGPSTDAATSTWYVADGDIQEIRPTLIDIEAVMSHAWSVWRERLGLLLGSTVLYYGISIAVDMALRMIATEQAVQNGIWDIALTGAAELTSFLVDFWLGIGLTMIYLAVSRRRPASIGMMFQGGDRLLPVLGGTVLFVIGLIGSTVLLVIPGILFGLWMYLQYYLLVDRQCGVLQAFSISMSMAKPNWLTTIALLVISFLILVLGFLAIIVGIVFAMPMVGVMFATAYLMMKGERLPDHLTHPFVR